MGVQSGICAVVSVMFVNVSGTSKGTGPSVLGWHELFGSFKLFLNAWTVLGCLLIDGREVPDMVAVNA